MNDHLRTQLCEVRAPVEIEGVSHDQQRSLSKRTNSKHTLEEQWYSIWDILYPNTARPDSVYLEKVFSDEMFLLWQYMITEGVTTTRNYLNAHNAIVWTSPGNEADLDSFQHSVVRGVLQKLFEGMNDFMKGVDTQQSPTQANPSPSTPSNHEFQALSSSRLANMTGTDSPGNQVQTDPAPHPDTTSVMSFSDIGSAAGGLEGPHEPESQFDHLYHMLRAGSTVQSQHTEETTDDQTSDFSFPNA
jgi:hypothetical protein